MNQKTLLIPDKPDIERDALASAWEEKGGEVIRVGKFWEKPAVGNKKVAIYGYDTFSLVLAQVLGVQLLSPRDEVIAELDFRWTKRNIQLIRLRDIGGIEFPIFIKSVVPKLFEAKVFLSVEAFQAKVEELQTDEQLLVADIVNIEKEVRVFVLNQRVADLAYYEGEGDIEEPARFAQDFLDNSKTDLPKTFVMDLGYDPKLGWFVIEFNSSWGSGLNSCLPEKVISCIKAATLS